MRYSRRCRRPVIESLQREFPFYTVDEQAAEVRWDVLVGHHRGGRGRVRRGGARCALRCLVGALGDTAIFEATDAVDLDHDDVAVCQQQRGLAAIADAGGRAGQDQVAGLERGELRDQR